jgi:hypothetical protein
MKIKVSRFKELTKQAQHAVQDMQESELAEVYGGLFGTDPLLSLRNRGDECAIVACSGVACPKVITCNPILCLTVSCGAGSLVEPDFI